MLQHAQPTNQMIPDRLAEIEDNVRTGFYRSPYGYSLDDDMKYLINEVKRLRIQADEIKRLRRQYDYAVDTLRGALRSIQLGNHE